MDINATIKEIKKRVTILTKHFPYTEYEINLITLAYIAFTMLDPTIDDMIDEVISNTFIFFTNKSVVEIYKMILPDAQEFIIDELEDADAVTYSYEFDSQKELHFYPFIIIEKNVSINDLLDSTIHELKHRINDVIIKYNGDSYYSGLNLNSPLQNDYYNIDEAFNSYLVMIYFNNLLTLKKYNIEDVKIKEILEQLSKSQSYSYSNLVKPCLPLFQSKTLFWLFYNASLYKDMKPLYDFLDEVFQHQFTWVDFFDALDYEDDKAIIDMLDNIDYSLVYDKHKLPTI